MRIWRLRETQVKCRRAARNKLCGYGDCVKRKSSVDAQRVTNYADMAKLVDALASGASARKSVEVQVLLSAP